jgi:hypothetical protein
MNSFTRKHSSSFDDIISSDFDEFGFKYYIDKIDYKFEVKQSAIQKTNNLINLDKINILLKDKKDGESITIDHLLFRYVYYKIEDRVYKETYIINNNEITSFISIELMNFA